MQHYHIMYRLYHSIIPAICIVADVNLTKNSKGIFNITLNDAISNAFVHLHIEYQTRSIYSGYILSHIYKCSLAL